MNFWWHFTRVSSTTNEPVTNHHCAVVYPWALEWGFGDWMPFLVSTGCELGKKWWNLETVKTSGSLISSSVRYIYKSIHEYKMFIPIGYIRCLTWSIRLQVLVALACDLGLDSFLSSGDCHKWLWFRRYCMASRVASALQDRTTLPVAFCEEVFKKIQEVSADNEKISRDHENHDLFKREQDEQLLLWLNRFVYFVVVIIVIYFLFCLNYIKWRENIVIFFVSFL